MNIVKATDQFERWLGRTLDLVKPDLLRKHSEMSESCFSFFRATCYRWAQLWPKLCGDLDDVPEVIAVGDLHVENFGTWRDKEGRLVWGINDFDEAFPLPYTADLIRLAVSVELAKRERTIRIDLPGAIKAILDGYRSGIESRGFPIVLAEKETSLRKMARHRLQKPEKFWTHLLHEKKIRALPRRPRHLITAALEAVHGEVHFIRRVAGLGSLGHERFVGWTMREGAKIAREAKARSPSVWVWAGRQHRAEKDYYRKILASAVRCPDPSLKLTRHWVVRRLSPDCSRIELDDLPQERNEKELLWSMGKETANIHLASSDPGLIARHLKKPLKLANVEAACLAMTAAVESDWKAWRKAFPPKSREGRRT
jgi:hypothetical protein